MEEVVFLDHLSTATDVVADKASPPREAATEKREPRNGNHQQWAETASQGCRCCSWSSVGFPVDIPFSPSHLRGVSVQRHRRDGPTVVSRCSTTGPKPLEGQWFSFSGTGRLRRITEISFCCRQRRAWQRTDSKSRRGEVVWPDIGLTGSGKKRQRGSST